jgi:SAM-dependent methyltransferase
MNTSADYQGTLNYIFAHWPLYIFTYGGSILCLIFMGISAERGWFGYIPLTLALVIVLLYFLLANTWAAHLQFDRNGLRPHLVLFEMARLRPSDHLVYIDLGLRRRPLGLSHYLTTGHITVIDIYNPQATPDAALARWRSRVKHAPSDPRLTWQVGYINLLPLPDHSIATVIVCQIASELWQHGDRVALLREVERILTAEGRLLFAENIRTQTTWLTHGPMALAVPTLTYWHTLLQEAGFIATREQTLGGLVRCFAASKQSARQVQQLAFNLDLGE